MFEPWNIILSVVVDISKEEISHAANILKIECFLDTQKLRWCEVLCVWEGDETL